jgi:hypothetical protein
LGVCAISYDGEEILRHFTGRAAISYPLLSDWNSSVIRKFGIMNNTIPADQPAYGVPFPGSYLVNEKGIVVSKFFEEDYRDRTSVGTVLTRFFDSPLNTKQTRLQFDHATVDYYASSRTAYSGNRISLIAEVQLPAGVHVYAPGVQGYKPIKWELVPSLGFSQQPILYPEPKVMRLEAIQESVPVFTGHFRMVQDVIVTPNPRALPRALTPDGDLIIEGQFQYQACDEKTCYFPQTVPLRWVIKVLDLDTQRVPENLRKVP